MQKGDRINTMICDMTFRKSWRIKRYGKKHTDAENLHDFLKQIRFEAKASGPNSTIITASYILTKKQQVAQKHITSKIKMINMKLKKKNGSYSL